MFPSMFTSPAEALVKLVSLACPNSIVSKRGPASEDKSWFTTELASIVIVLTPVVVFCPNKVP